MTGTAHTMLDQIYVDSAGELGDVIAFDSSKHTFAWIGLFNFESWMRAFSGQCFFGLVQTRTNLYLPFSNTISSSLLSTGVEIVFQSDDVSRSTLVEASNFKGKEISRLPGALDAVSVALWRTLSLDRSLGPTTREGTSAGASRLCLSCSHTTTLNNIIFWSRRRSSNDRGFRVLKYHSRENSQTRGQFRRVAMIYAILYMERVQNACC